MRKTVKKMSCAILTLVLTSGVMLMGGCGKGNSGSGSVSGTVSGTSSDGGSASDSGSGSVSGTVSGTSSDDGSANGAASAANNAGWTDPACWDGKKPLYSPFGTKPDGADYWPAPNMCKADPWGVNDNPISDLFGVNSPDATIDGFKNAAEVRTLLANDKKTNGHYNVHLIDVRVSEEQFNGIAPCLTAIGLPTFPMTNSGHPVFKRDDGTWEESYHVPIFAGYYWAGTQRVPDSTRPDNVTLPDGQKNTPINRSYWALNIRPEPNPNFVALGYQDKNGNNVTIGGYFKALVDQGELTVPDPKDPNAQNLILVVMCQTGWRGAYAAAIIKNLPVFANNPHVLVYNLYGGFRGWNGASGGIDKPGADFGGVLVDPAGNGGNGTCANQYLDPTSNEPVTDLNSTFACPSGKNLKVVPTYEHITAAASDPTLADRYAYNITRLVRDGQVPLWDGVETHVGQKPEWMVGFGATDFFLKPVSGLVQAFWANKSDYDQGILTVIFPIQNDRKDYVGNNGSQLNYYRECGAAPAPEGLCHPVLYDPWGSAYNTRVASAAADNGVALLDTGLGALLDINLGTTPDTNLGTFPVTSLGTFLDTNLSTLLDTAGVAGVIPPGGIGLATVKYKVPKGVTSFTTQPLVTATDIPDSTKSFFGASFAFYFTYTYTDWNIKIRVPQTAPLL